MDRVVLLPRDGATIAVVGAGRLGTAITTAMRACGLPVFGPSGRTDPIREADICILCVPDDQIRTVAATISTDCVLAHCAGSLPLSVLHPHAAFSLHPLVSVAKRTTAFKGVYCAIAASTPETAAIARDLADCLGMRPFAVPDAARARYHAAATMASNYLVSLLDSAELLAKDSGCPREALIVLARRAVEQWASEGAERALTGPIARGDLLTIARQRDAVGEIEEVPLSFWDELTSSTMRLAARRGTQGGKPLLTPK